MGIEDVSSQPVDLERWIATPEARRSKEGRALTSDKLASNGTGAKSGGDEARVACSRDTCGAVGCEICSRSNSAAVAERAIGPGEVMCCGEVRASLPTGG